MPEALGGVGARQGGVAARRRGRRPLRVVCDDVRRPDGSGDHAAALLRVRGTEDEVPAARSFRGDDDWRVCAVSESGSGSDALGAKARAVPQPDGSFLLTGEKMWITNGGFADLFIVFAKVVSRRRLASGQFTAFLVERAFPGVSSGKEEHKMGLHGSSTTPLILQDARVPAENVLGEIGKGHKVAFNVLNYGRFKLAAMCSGGARRVIAQAAAYAAQRKQFGQPIASFGAVRHKLAEMVVREYAVEAMLYRTAGLIEGAVDGSSRERGRARRARGVRHRGIDPQGRGQRDDRLRRRRERADPRRQRLRARLSRPRASTATRGSTASSKAPTRSTGC